MLIPRRVAVRPLADRGGAPLGRELPFVGALAMAGLLAVSSLAISAGRGAAKALPETDRLVDTNPSSLLEQWDAALRAVSPRADALAADQGYQAAYGRRAPASVAGAAPGDAASAARALGASSAGARDYVAAFQRNLVSMLQQRASVVAFTVPWNAARAVNGAPVESGRASWYGYESGTTTATGERWDPHGMTAASNTLPLNTRVRVVNRANGRSVDLRINDRGGFTRLGRVLDLSQGAFQRLASLDAGLIDVDVYVLQ